MYMYNVDFSLWNFFIFVKIGNCGKFGICGKLDLNLDLIMFIIDNCLEFIVREI